MNTPAAWEIGQVWERNGFRWRVCDFDEIGACLQSERTEWARTIGLRLSEQLAAGWVCVEHRDTCCCVECLPTPRDDGGEA